MDTIFNQSRQRFAILNIFQVITVTFYHVEKYVAIQEGMFLYNAAQVSPYRYL